MHENTNDIPKGIIVEGLQKLTSEEYEARMRAQWEHYAKTLTADEYGNGRTNLKPLAKRYIVDEDGRSYFDGTVPEEATTHEDAPLEQDKPEGQGLKHRAIHTPFPKNTRGIGRSGKYPV
jgi:hypothetical protein